jgi:hypothetical protein
MLAFRRRFGSCYPMTFLSEYTTVMLKVNTVNVPQLTAVSLLIKALCPITAIDWNSALITLAPKAAYG